MSLAEHLVFFPVLVPMLVGIILLLPPFHQNLERQRPLVMAANLGLLVVAVLLLGQAVNDGPSLYRLGDWHPPFGILLVADQLASLMLILTAILAMTTHWYACAGDDGRGPFFQPLFMFQLMGINGAFLTADAFNLFVFFEILLIASYALLIHGGGKHRTQAAVHYVLLNLIGSAFFLIGLGILYASFGSLNLPDMAQKASQLSDDNIILAKSGGLLLLLVFGLKSAMLPLHFWLVRTYSMTSAPVAALFAIMTKVGIYSIWRVHTAVFGDHAGELSGLASDWLWVLGLLTIAVGAVAALASQTLRVLTANLVVVSAGTLLISIAVGTEEATAAAIYYLLHSTLMSAALFLLAGLIQEQRGQAQDRFVKAKPLPQAVPLGIAFFILAMAMVGMPPLSGFLGKVWLLQATVSHDMMAWVWSVLLISGLAALVVFSRAGTSIFWRVQGQPGSDVKAHGLQWLALYMLLSMSLLMVVFAGPLTDLSASAASELYSGLALPEPVEVQP
ncbi:monovalent cation/H+ antiporter subunit D [Bacterioplanes sanyensis]|uniref:Monovalent cation/H+ antiporter subunit D n=1 Tax=Bacterioplanes sanyensis TaxID=1249553 RepID=A0A222FED4_9GAMM|nr:monovalent cation/H+ antiporter subunit D [Bacterioplanes sanyensis]ASP37457.1 monovalent cation/H+ antiporter subunit D [Bacterioplanes sanyensis]